MKVGFICLLSLLICSTACGRKPTHKEKRRPEKPSLPLLHLPSIPRAVFNRATNTLSWDAPAVSPHAPLTGYALYRYQANGFIPPTPCKIVNKDIRSLQLDVTLAHDERLAMRPLYKNEETRLTLVCFNEACY